MVTAKKVGEDSMKKQTDDENLKAFQENTKELEELIFDQNKDLEELAPWLKSKKNAPLKNLAKNLIALKTSENLQTMDAYKEFRAERKTSEISKLSTLHRLRRQN